MRSSPSSEGCLWVEYDEVGFGGALEPGQDVTLIMHRKDGTSQECQLLLRIDTPIEVDCTTHGGILPYVLYRLLVRQCSCGWVRGIASHLLRRTRR